MAKIYKLREKRKKMKKWKNEKMKKWKNEKMKKWKNKYINILDYIKWSLNFSN
jgi:hypothetical protein